MSSRNEPVVLRCPLADFNDAFNAVQTLRDFKSRRKNAKTKVVD
jgi:hypothetical protein